MNSHCHVQGRVAQGQLIAFMIMISRQIYCACSEHIFQVLPTLLAQMGKMSLQLQAVTSCLSAGHTFWLIRVECRGWITQAFPVKASLLYVITVLAFLIFYSYLYFVFHMCSSLEVMTEDWYRQWFLVFLLFEVFTTHKSLIFVSVHWWNHYACYPHICQNYLLTAFWCWWLFVTVPPASLKRMKWVQPIL